MAVQTQIQVRRGTASSWTSTNPTLAAGEIGFESDTNKFKIGTGSATWNSLAYASNVSPLTTKGDLYTYSTTNTRLPVGADGQQLVADSSQTTGLGWAGNVAAGKNAVINGGFDIWQRGTSFSIASGGTSTYTADRWTYAITGYASTISRQLTGDTTNLPFIQYCARVQRNSGQTGTGASYFVQGIETVNSIPLAGKTVTVSFYARKGANYSATSDILTAYVQVGTGTDENPQSGYTNQSTILQENKTLTTTWQRFTFTSVTVPSNSTEIKFILGRDSSGTAGANDYYEVTGVQLEVGSTATPFSRNASTIQGELAACQRYFEQYDAASGQVFYTGFQQTSTSPRISLSIAPKRTTPTITYTGTLQVMVTGGTTYNATSIDAIAYAANSNTLGFRANIAAGGTAGDACALYSSGAVSILYSSEL